MILNCIFELNWKFFPTLANRWKCAPLSLNSRMEKLFSLLCNKAVAKKVDERSSGWTQAATRGKKEKMHLKRWLNCSWQNLWRHLESSHRSRMNRGLCSYLISYKLIFSLAFEILNFDRIWFSFCKKKNGFENMFTFEFWMLNVSGTKLFCFEMLIVDVDGYWQYLKA